jgi:hypothetical protein
MQDMQDTGDMEASGRQDLMDTQAINPLMAHTVIFVMVCGGPAQSTST